MHDLGHLTYLVSEVDMGEVLPEEEELLGVGRIKSIAISFQDV